MRKGFAGQAAFFVLLIGVIFDHTAFAQNSEQILSFHSDISVQSDATMTVTERITVVSTRTKIRHGIYRDFPTRYKDRYGNAYAVKFDVLSVSRDGRAEAYHTQGLSNGTRVYFGSADYDLPSGEHTYTLVYRTDRQLGFFEDHDELFWNVTGNGWEFPIVEASAVVELPDGAGRNILKYVGYTGAQGSMEEAVTITTDTFDRPVFKTTRVLRPQEGLTIAVAWPKGYVKEPNAQDKLAYFVADNRPIFAGILGFLVVLIYYLFFWHHFGRDPKRGTIVPLFYPPENLSPEAVRYIVKMGFDNKTFTAAIIEMAVRGYLKIEESAGTYTLKKTGQKEDVLSREQRGIGRTLLGSGRNTLLLKDENHAIISRAISQLKSLLKNNFEKSYFLRNTRYFIPGVALSIFFVVVTGAFASPVVIFMYVWLSIWTLGVFALGLAVWNLWKGVRSLGSLGAAVFMTIFAIPFFGGEIFGIGILAASASYFVVAILLAIIFLNFLFYHLLKAPTLLGRKILDKIEGFKMFLSVAEKDRLNVLNPPEKTPELFEKYLPYALALDVEQKWAEQFTGVFARLAQQDTTYVPVWYTGHSWGSFNTGTFASHLGSSFSGAVASSAVAPGSSSGFSGGGGGGSGGGGGGGGGGGW